MNEDGSITLVRRDLDAIGTEEEWLPLLEIPADDALGTGVLNFSRDGRSLLLLSSIGANASRLMRLDLETGEQTEIAGDEKYDVARRAAASGNARAAGGRVRQGPRGDRAARPEPRRRS